MALRVDPIKRFELRESGIVGAGITGRGDPVEALRRATALQVYGRLLDDFRDHPADMQRLADMDRDAAVRAEVRYMVDRVAWAREVLSFEPEPLQVEALRSWARRLIFNCNRQFGKSTLCAIRALHRAVLYAALSPLS